MFAIDHGADFVKTSTGKTPVSATPEAAEIVLEAIDVSGRPVGFKASGGIRTSPTPATYLDLADSIMGPDWATPATFRFGASGLLDALEARHRRRDRRPECSCIECLRVGPARHSMQQILGWGRSAPVRRSGSSTRRASSSSRTPSSITTSMIERRSSRARCTSSAARA